jgi:hypothetical protein
MENMLLPVLFAFITLFSINANAEEVYKLIIKDHKFSPENLEVPAGKKLKIEVSNEDPTPEEFESHDLKKEKIIKGNSKGLIIINPLKAGEYSFFGEFNEKTAKGKLVAK